MLLLSLKTKAPMLFCAYTHRLSESGRQLVQETVKLNRGTGLTNKQPLSRLFTRFVYITTTWGDTGHQLHQLTQ